MEKAFYNWSATGFRGSHKLGIRWLYTPAVFVNRRFQVTLHIFSEMLLDECSEFDKPARVTTGKLLMVIKRPTKKI